MKVVLKTLKIKNFRGIKYFVSDFSEKENFFIGDNQSGKTTLVNAFLWLLTGKDNKDRQDFNIKTFDKDGQVIHNLEHEVTGVFTLDGDEHELSRIFKEVWRRNKTTGQKELVSNTTVYKIDGVDQKARDYKAFVEDKICKEELFKLLSNPLYFPELLHWTKQRQILFDIVGDISPVEIAEGDERFTFIKEALKKKGIDGYKKQIRAELSKLKDEVEKTLPARIDEVLLAIPDAVDVSGLSKEKEALKDKVKTLERSKFSIIEQDKEKAKQISDLQRKINELNLKKENRISELKLKAQRGVNELNGKLEAARGELDGIQIKKGVSKNKIERLKSEIDTIKAEIEKLETKRQELRGKWNSVSLKQIEFNDEDFVCPTCKRPLDAIDVAEKQEKMLENFNQTKSKELSEIKDKGVTIAKEIESKKEKMRSLSETIGTITKEIEALELEEKAAKETYEKIKAKRDEKANNEEAVDPLKDEEVANIISEIEAIKSEIEGLKDKTFDTKTVDEKISKIELQISEIDKKLNEAATREGKVKRHKELLAELERAQKLLVEKEKELYLIGEVTTKRVTLLEEKVNNLFKLVKFRLFTKQVNGDLSETCEAMVNGVPFSSLNTASQINAGLDILNVIGNFYNIKLPVFIDNRETVSKIEVDTNNQIVHLFKVAGSSLKKVDKEPVLTLSDK